MKFIKNQNINPKLLRDKTVSSNADKQVILETTEAVLVPKGTTAERPASPQNGFLRFNTDDGEFEVYQNSAWREIAFKQPATIAQQRFEDPLDPNVPLDGINFYFGPINSGDPDFVAPDVTKPQNVLVFVGVVMQIGGINYELEENPAGLPSGTYVRFTDEAPPEDTSVTIISGFDK